MTLLLGGLCAGHLEAAEVNHAQIALRTHVSKWKVSVCIAVTLQLFVWALSKGEDFHFIFENIGLLVCRERRVVRHVLEGVIQAVGKTGKLAKSFDSVSLGCFQGSLYFFGNVRKEFSMGCLVACAKPGLQAHEFSAEFLSGLEERPGAGEALQGSCLWSEQRCSPVAHVR